MNWSVAFAGACVAAAVAVTLSVTGAVGVVAVVVASAAGYLAGRYSGSTARQAEAAAGEKTRDGQADAWCAKHRGLADRSDVVPPCGVAYREVCDAVVRATLPPWYSPCDPDLESLRRFETARKGTKCIFAASSRVWGSPDWDESLGVEGNTLQAVPAVAMFVAMLRCTRPDVDLDVLARMAAGARVRKEDWRQGRNGDRSEPGAPPPLDAFLVEVRGAEHGSTVEAFARTVARVLQTLSDHDPGTLAPDADDCSAAVCSLDAYYRRPGQNGPLQHRWGVGALDVPDAVIASPSWHFSFMGEPFFVTTFAPCFPAGHPRHMFPEKGVNDDSCFIMLQPEVAFLHRNISPDTPLTNDPPRTDRDRIRRAFADSGAPYYVPPVLAYPTASYIVPPVPVFDAEGKPNPVVRWWEMRRRRSFY